MIQILVELISKLYGPMRDAIVSAKRLSSKHVYLGHCRKAVSLFLRMNNVYRTGVHLVQTIEEVVSFRDGQSHHGSIALGKTHVSSIVFSYRFLHESAVQQRQNVLGALSALGDLGDVLTVLDYRLKNELSFWLDRKFGVIGELESVLSSGLPFGVDVSIKDHGNFLSKHDELNFAERRALRDNLSVRTSLVIKPEEKSRLDDPSLEDKVDERGRIVLWRRYYINAERLDDRSLSDGIVDVLRAILYQEAKTKSLESLDGLLGRYDQFLKAQFSGEDLIEMLKHTGGVT